MEKVLAERLQVEYVIAPQTAQTMANLILTQQDVPGRELTKTDETTALKMAEFAMQRSKEFGNTENDTLRDYRLFREVTQMQTHIMRHGTMPSTEKLKQIQEIAESDTLKITFKIHQEHMAQMQREQTLTNRIKL